MVAHITPGELGHYLGRTEAQNGFANRCLWAAVHRSQSLPDGGSLPSHQLAAIARELRSALQWAQTQTEIIFRRTPAAAELWRNHYPALSQSRPDNYGAATSRAEAQVLRLSALYAALDRSLLVDVCHLQAALAVWDYCQASAALFFDALPTDPVARRIAEAIDASAHGLTKTQIRALFHRHATRDCIDLALEQLISLGYTSRPSGSGQGRPSTLWSQPHTPKPTGPSLGA